MCNVNHPTSTANHNSLINAQSHYQRHDFKNRRSSSEPEQKLFLAQILNNHNQNSNSNTNTNSTNNSSLVINEASIENPSDDFIDYQKTIKVSKHLRDKSSVFLKFSKKKSQIQDLLQKLYLSLSTFTTFSTNFFSLSLTLIYLFVKNILKKKTRI